MNLKKLRDYRGFTMIELIIVIAVLGILAAFALPRFANFTVQAQAASRASVVGSLNASLGIAHAQWIAGGTNAAGEIFLENQSGVGNGITVDATGFPDIGATNAYKDAATCQTLGTRLLSNQNGLTFGYSAGACTVAGSNWASLVTITSASAQ